MTYIFLIILGIVWILKYAFSKFMERKYNITNSEFQKIKDEIINKPRYILIFLVVLLYLLISAKSNIYITIIFLVVITIGEFIYGLIKIKKSNKDIYTLYYIGDELISSLIIMPAIVLLVIS